MIHNSFLVFNWHRKIFMPAVHWLYLVPTQIVLGSLK